MQKLELGSKEGHWAPASATAIALRTAATCQPSSKGHAPEYPLDALLVCPSPKKTLDFGDLPCFFRRRMEATLEKRLDAFAVEQCPKQHKGTSELLLAASPRNSSPYFRLFLSTDPSLGIPIGLLERSIKLTNEPPQGLQANLRPVGGAKPPAAPAAALRAGLASACSRHGSPPAATAGAPSRSSTGRSSTSGTARSSYFARAEQSREVPPFRLPQDCRFLLAREVNLVCLVPLSLLDVGAEEVWGFGLQHARILECWHLGSCRFCLGALSIQEVPVLQRRSS